MNQMTQWGPIAVIVGEASRRRFRRRHGGVLFGRCGKGPRFAFDRFNPKLEKNCSIGGRQNPN
jgi:hypothetical protein